MNKNGISSALPTVLPTAEHWEAERREEDREKLRVMALRPKSTQAIAMRALEKEMLDYPDKRNRKPKPFVWMADADLILGKAQRLCKRISSSGHWRITVDFRRDSPFCQSGAM